MDGLPLIQAEFGHSLYRQMNDPALMLAHGLIRALALRHHETEQHCERVAAWSKKLAQALHLSAYEINHVELGALLHDVGKIGIRDAVLLKPGPLDAQEWEEMKKHPELGAELLSRMPLLSGAISIVQNHHERLLGDGYPRGLKKEQIPIEARIFQLVDAYDAITHDRPYRQAQSDAHAREEIKRYVNLQFDPTVFEAFMNIDAQEWQALEHVNKCVVDKILQA